MDIDDMRIVLLVAQEENLTRAADKAFLSQSALSRLVRRVEEALGTPLFDRTPRRLTLTAAGERFCARTAQVLDDLDHATAEARAIAQDFADVRTPDANLTVGWLVPAAAELTSHMVNAYRRAFPGAHVTSVDVSELGGERALTDGVVDVAFLWTPLRSDDLAVVSLFDDQVVALLGADHPLRSRPLVTADDLALEPYTVTRSMSARWQTASLLRPWRHRPDNARPVETVNDALALIASGEAVSIGPRSLERFPASHVIRCVPIELAGRPTSVLCHRPSDRRRCVRAFAAIANEMARSLGHTVPNAFEPHGPRPLGTP